MNRHPSQRRVTGTVHWREGGAVSSCHVSNGQTIAPVNGNGTYSLPFEPGRHRFIFVIPPDDGVAFGPFWRVAGEHGSFPRQQNFLLEKRADKSDQPVRFLHITDTHLVTGKPDPHCVAFYSKKGSKRPHKDTPSAPRLRRTLQQLIEGESGLDFIVVTGDITDMGDLRSLRAAARVFASVPVPIFVIFGGHDGNTERAIQGRGEGYKAAYFSKHLAPPYYSWNWNGRHFISFVSETHFLDSKTADMQRAFIDADLALFAEQRPVTVCSHKHPYPWNIGPFRGHNVDSWVHGHFHSGRVYDDEGIRIFSTGTVTLGAFDLTRAQARIVTAHRREQPTSRPLALPLAVKKPTSTHQRGPIVVLWRSEVDSLSYLAGPCVIDDAIYCGAVDDQAGVNGGVIALQHDGAALWQTPVAGSVIAPLAVNRDRIVTVTQTGKIVCLDRREGSICWQHDLPDTFDRWVYNRPLIVRQRVIVGTTSLLACLSMRNGKIRWLHQHPTVSSDAFCQLQESALFDNRLFLPGYATESHLMDADTGQVLRLNDDRHMRFTSRSMCVDGCYFVGAADGCLHCFDLADGRSRWCRRISQSAITSGCAPYRSSVIVGTAEGIGRYATSNGRRLAFHAFGPSLGMYVPDRNQSCVCPGTPCVDGDTVWAASGDGWINLLESRSLRLIGRSDLQAPVLSPLVTDSAGRVYAVDVSGRLLCMQHTLPG